MSVSAATSAPLARIISQKGWTGKSGVTLPDRTWSHRPPQIPPTGCLKPIPFTNMVGRCASPQSRGLFSGVSDLVVVVAIPLRGVLVVSWGCRGEVTEPIPKRSPSDSSSDSPAAESDCLHASIAVPCTEPFPPGSRRFAPGLYLEGLFILSR